MIPCANGYWRKHYAGKRRTTRSASRLTLDGKARTIVGALPQSQSAFPRCAQTAAHATPAAVQRAFLDRKQIDDGGFFFGTVVRAACKPGVEAPPRRAPAMDGTSGR